MSFEDLNKYYLVFEAEVVTVSFDHAQLRVTKTFKGPSLDQISSPIDRINDCLVSAKRYKPGHRYLIAMPKRYVLSPSEVELSECNLFVDVADAPKELAAAKKLKVDTSPTTAKRNRNR